MERRRIFKWSAAIFAIVAAAWLLRACYDVFVNKEDRPAADRIVAALDAYHAAKGRYPLALNDLVAEYLPALPTPRRFGRIGYAPLDGGRGCLVGYYTHRDFLEEYDCGTKAWSAVEYNDSRIVKARPAEWLSGPTQ